MHMRRSSLQSLEKEATSVKSSAFHVDIDSVQHLPLVANRIFMMSVRVSSVRPPNPFQIRTELFTTFRWIQFAVCSIEFSKTTTKTTVSHKMYSTQVTVGWQADGDRKMHSNRTYHQRDFAKLIFNIPFWHIPTIYGPRHCHMPLRLFVLCDTQRAPHSRTDPQVEI